jgi:hypothetical protein
VTNRYTMRATPMNPTIRSTMVQILSHAMAYSRHRVKKAARTRT